MGTPPYREYDVPAPGGLLHCTPAAAPGLDAPITHQLNVYDSRNEEHEGQERHRHIIGWTSPTPKTDPDQEFGKFHDASVDTRRRLQGWPSHPACPGVGSNIQRQVETGYPRRYCIHYPAKRTKHSAHPPCTSPRIIQAPAARSIIAPVRPSPPRPGRVNPASRGPFRGGHSPLGGQGRRTCQQGRRRRRRQ